MCTGKVPDPTAVPPVKSTCTAVTDNRKYYAVNVKEFAGPFAMKADIFRNGPISCGIDATAKFEEYRGGIFSEDKSFPEINHIIALVGWGVDKDSGEEFWIGRNSWGSWWGENGYFRISMYHNNLAVEQDCTSGEPSYDFIPDAQFLVE